MVERVSEVERELAGGNASTGVVRVGDTVRKPWREGTPAMVEFMAAVRAAGVDVPQVLGRDEQGRQVIEFVEGSLALDLPPLSIGDLERVGRIVRAIHDASDGFVPLTTPHWECAIPSPGRDLICHGDLAPWNLIVGERWVVIDWDGSAPSTRLWDLAYSAQAFTLNDPTRPPTEAADCLAAFIRGYGADRALRTALPATMTTRVAAMHDLLRCSHTTGAEPWATMYVTGHGDHWAAALEYVASHQSHWVESLTVRQSGAPVD